jgi:hypothetical protein
MFTPEVLDQISEICAHAGIELTKKLVEGKSTKEQTAMEKRTESARCDSFVLKTDVHFPTDINLLWDAVRKSILLCEKAADQYPIDGWRQ